ncbi:hypothetical protein IFM46972_10402 [Aspergillus udagawae]|uniref:NAD(P)-binding domain-containing protein n=1 Tax=Aspergillus udagawae TaxID=91492 RepID=A0A8H3XQ06_9EURO|nr:hypothetical protein IFM46972_10402 [Aspergillus udagawae]
MLVLIAGITGLVGIPCARSAFERGHKVRGLARSIDNLPEDVRNQLECFETISDYHDIAAMDRATKGVDGIICAFAALPEMFMETQFLLIRAAERSGVKVYDDIRGFAHHVAVSSSIKPIYMFTGAIADYSFKRSRCDWDPDTNTFNFHGPSTFPTRYTTAEDIGNYVLEVITAPNTANGDFSTAREGRITAKLNCLGSLKDAEDKLNEGQAEYGKSGWYNYIRYCYQYHIPARSWDHEPADVARFPNVKQTRLEEFFRRNPDV